MTIENSIGVSRPPLKKKSRRIFKGIEPWLFLLPLIIVLIFSIYPLIYAIWLSFTDKQIGFAPNFTGLTNYISLLSDPLFLQATKNTLIFTVAAVLFKLILGIIMALIVNEEFPLRNISRGILALPWVIPTVVGVLIWYWMLNESNGVVNVLLGTYVPWLSNGSFALFSIIFVNIWRGFPFFGVNLLAGLQSISPEMYDAAKVDGANSLGRFRFITLPGLKYVIFITVTLSTIWTINDFQLVHLLTGGGPGTSTQILSTLTYQVGIQTLQLGRGIAISIFMLPLLVIGIFLMVKWINKE